MSSPLLVPSVPPSRPDVGVRVLRPARRVDGVGDGPAVAARAAAARPVHEALAALAAAPRLTTAMRMADDLRLVAAISSDREGAGPIAAALIDAVRAADDVTAIAAVHALGAVPHPSADEALVSLVAAGQEPFAGHAAWTLGARRSSPAAEAALERLEDTGGFSAMLAERTLRSWRGWDAADESFHGGEPGDRAELVASGEPSGVVELLGSDVPTGAASWTQPGIVVIQPFLHARIDRTGSSLGVGDAGGIASLLRSLGTSLGERPEIAQVVTVTRRHAGEQAGERLTDDHVVVRLDVGGTAPLPWREAWVHRVAIERQLLALGRRLAGPQAGRQAGRQPGRQVVWHLRMADVGTLAAAAAARRLGQPVVFTAAPDPHIVIDALQDDRRLDRHRFAVEDAATQFWFRARMVERLAAQADRVVVLPRPSIERELVDLVGLDPEQVRTRVTVVPEGVDVATIDEAIAARAASATSATAGREEVPPAVRSVIERLPAHRRDLPWVLSVGRLHPTKGHHRIVAAVAADPALRDAVNVVLVGGALRTPSADEQSTIELIRGAAATADPALVTLTGNLAPRDVADLMVHVAATGGVYVGAADKEEFGLAIVEAMAAGAVVVAPERGGPRSYVDHGETGVLCDTLSIDAVRRAIARALEMAGTDDGRVARVRAAVRRDLGIGSMAAALVDVYGQVTGRPVTTSRDTCESLVGGRSTGGRSMPSTAAVERGAAA